MPRSPFRAVALALAIAANAAAPVRAASDVCALDRAETYATAFDLLMPVRRVQSDYLRRWYRPTIPVFVRNELSVDARPMIQRAVDDFNRGVFGTNRMRLVEYETVDSVPDDFMTPLGQSDRTELDGIFIALVTDERFRDLGRLVDRYPKPPTDKAAARKVYKTSNCYVRWYNSGKRHEVYHAVIWIREKSFEHPIRGCIYQELDHALGISRDHDDVYCTVHTGGRETVDELKPLDRRLLEILYHPAIDTQRPWHELRPIVDRLAKCAARQPSAPDGPRLAEACKLSGK